MKKRCRVSILIHACMRTIQNPNDGLSYPLVTKLIGGTLVSLYPSIRPCVRPSIRPSVHEIVSALYLLQYYLDQFQIYTACQPTSGNVSHVELLKNIKFEILRKYLTSWLSTSCSGLLWISIYVKITLNGQGFFSPFSMEVEKGVSMRH